jgi:hypothetical protein
MLLRKRKEKKGKPMARTSLSGIRLEIIEKAVIWSRSSLISIPLLVFISRRTWEFLCQIKHRMPDPHWNLGRIYITDETGKSVGPALQHSDASWLTGAYRLSELTLRFSQIAVMMMPIRQCITLSKQNLDLQYVRCPSIPATCGTTSGVRKKTALLVVHAQKPLQYYATYALFFPMEAQSTRVVY